MQLHNIQPKHKRYARPRVGRGGKRGTTSGRGQKGQRSRSGHRIRPAERDLIQRLPKLRGFHNKPNTLKTHAISLGRIAAFKDGVITPDTLQRLMGSGARRFKIIGGGTISRKLQLKGIAVSKGVRKAIEAAGGSVGEKR